MGTDDDARQAKNQLSEAVTKVIVAVVSAAAVAAFGLGWNLDRAILSHSSQLQFILERQDNLRQQLRCNPVQDPHPLCSRLERIDEALKHYYKETR